MQALSLPSMLLVMEFPERVTALRKERSLTQQALADRVGVHVLQIRRYEGGTSQPTLDVVRRLALALSVSADVLVFEKTERDPSEDLRLQFEAIDQLPPEEQAVVKEVLESLIIKYQTRRWDVSRATAKAAVATTNKAAPPSKTPTKRAAHAAR